MGCFGCLVTYLVIFRMFSMWGHLSAWHNPELTPEVRDALDKWFSDANKNIGQLDDVGSANDVLGMVKGQVRGARNNVKKAAAAKKGVTSVGSKGDSTCTQSCA